MLVLGVLVFFSVDLLEFSVVLGFIIGGCEGFYLNFFGELGVFIMGLWCSLFIVGLSEDLCLLFLFEVGLFGDFVWSGGFLWF